MNEWQNRALFEVMAAQYDPDHAPEFIVPARKWWQLWKPRWCSVKGVSANEIRRAHGLDTLPSRLVKATWA